MLGTVDGRDQFFMVKDVEELLTMSDAELELIWREKPNTPIGVMHRLLSHLRTRAGIDSSEGGGDGR